jgi:hypothetical protein
MCHTIVLAHLAHTITGQNRHSSNHTHGSTEVQALVHTDCLNEDMALNPQSPIMQPDLTLIRWLGDRCQTC